MPRVKPTTTYTRPRFELRDVLTDVNGVALEDNLGVQYEIIGYGTEQLKITTTWT